MILDRPNNFGRVPIVLVGSNSFGTCPNHFCQVQIKFSGLTFTFWTSPKRICPVQNDWHSTKIIWTVQNNFGPIKRQGNRSQQLILECFE